MFTASLKEILLWRITSVGHPSCTFKEFFENIIKPASTASTSSADPPQNDSAQLQ